MSVGTVEENPYESCYSQGIGASLSLKLGNFKLADFAVEYSRKGNAYDGYNCPFSLFGDDFEFSTEFNQSTTYDLTIPIPGVSISINLSETADLFNKATASFSSFINKQFNKLFSKEE